MVTLVLGFLNGIIIGLVYIWGKTDSDIPELIKKAMLANSPKVLGEYQTKKGSPKIPRTKKQ